MDYGAPGRARVHEDDVKRQRGCLAVEKLQS